MYMILYEHTPANECRLRHDAISCACLLVYTTSTAAETHIIFFIFYFFIINRPYTR